MNRQQNNNNNKQRHNDNYQLPHIARTHKHTHESQAHTLNA